MVLGFSHLPCSLGNTYCQNPSGWVQVDPCLLSPSGSWFPKNMSMHTSRKPGVQGQPMHYSCPDTVSRGTYSNLVSRRPQGYSNIFCLTQNLLCNPQDILLSPVSGVFRSGKYLPLLFCLFFIFHTAPLLQNDYRF